MAPITTIVHFGVPPENIDQFFDFWQKYIKGNVSKQPGLLDGTFYRGIDPDGPYQFINVAHWDSSEQLEAGLLATGEELPIARVFRELGVKVSQNNYVEAVRYTADSKWIPFVVCRALDMFTAGWADAFGQEPWLRAAIRACPEPMTLADVGHFARRMGRRSLAQHCVPSAISDPERVNADSAQQSMTDGQPSAMAAVWTAVSVLQQSFKRLAAPTSPT
jgi:heme-degrading monooxygenase HmoA